MEHESLLPFSKEPTTAECNPRYHALSIENLFSIVLS
jgi:hypothetical protein